MVRYKCDPVTTDYADGTPAIRMVDDGSGMVYYKNGQIAIHVQTTDLGFIQQAFDDNRYRSVLMNFNEIGEGSCTHPPPKGASTGHPRYVCDKNRGKFVAEDGQITREWPWEAPIGSSWSPDIPEEWSFILNSCLSFKATSRQSQTLTFKCDSVTHEFNVGQMPKRSDTYLERHFLKWERGKAILDMAAKTETYHKTLPVVTLEGGFATTTMGGTTESAAEEEMLATMGSMDLSKTIAETVAKTNGMKKGKMAVMPFVEPEVMALNRSSIANPRKDIGGPQPPSMTVLNESVTMGMPAYHRSTKLDRSFALNSGGYHQPLTSRATKKKKLTLLKTKKYDHYLNNVVPPNQLCLVAVLDDAQAASRQVESMLQDKWGEACATIDPAGTTVDDFGKTHYTTMPLENLPYRLVKFSQTESRLLINRYNFHNAPMFLMYYGGKLVFASPVLGRDGLTRQNLDAAVDVCLQKAEEGHFLPDDFKFGIGAGMSIDQSGSHRPP